MGLFKILGAPVTVPASGLMYILRTIASEADKELYDPDVIRRQLSTMAEQLDAGQISEEDYEVAETELLDRLDAIAERRAADAEEAAAAEIEDVDNEQDE